MSQIVESNPLLVSVFNALPARIQMLIGPKQQRGQYMDVPHVGWFDTCFTDSRDPEPEALSLHFTGITKKRSRRYPVRKDGTLNLKLIVTIIVEIFDKRVAWLAEYQKRQDESNASFAEARRIGPFVFKKVKAGRRYRKMDDTHLAGGFNLYTKKGGLKGEIWAQTETSASGTIPFDDLPVEHLNAILSILNGHEYRILDEKRK